MGGNGKPWSFSPWAKIQETKAQQCAASLIGMFLNDKFKTIRCFIRSNNNNIFQRLHLSKENDSSLREQKGVMLLCDKKWSFMDLFTGKLLFRSRNLECSRKIN